MAYYGHPTQRAFNEYPKHLALLGHNVFVIAAQGQGELLSEKTKEGIEVRRIPVRNIKKLSLRPARFAVEAIRLIKSIDHHGPLDILHCYTSWEMGIIGLYFNQLQPNRFMTLYDIRSGALSGGRWYSAGRLVQQSVARIFDGVIVIDEALGRRFFPNRQLGYFVVPIGVDLSLFKPDPPAGQKVRKDLGIAPESVVAVYTGLIRNSRGARDLAEIAISSCEKAKWLEFMIVGGGPDFDEFRSEVSNSPVGRRIHTTGWVEHCSIPDYLNAADIGLSYVPKIPVFEPQPPLKTVEYLACGLPTIATDTQGHRTYIENGENGVIVSDNIQEISDTLVRISRKSALMSRLRRNTRDSIEPYSWDRIVQSALLPVYHNLSS
jgi:glycosyltransferase involved in cell wall biosynthesis